MAGQVVIGGTATGATPLPVATTIDGAVDYLPIYTASATATQAINRNTLLNLASGPVGLTDNQTLTNKTLTSPTISGPTFSGTLGGTYTIGGTPTFPASIVTLTGSQTLTNKTLTSPTINSPNITNATITADTLAGYTTSTTGTVYGMSVSAGILASAAIAGQVNSAAIATNAVTAAKLAATAITLGYAQITSDAPTTNTSPTQVTGLSATVTIPAGGRRIRISVCADYIACSNAVNVFCDIWDGTVGSGTKLRESSYTIPTGGGILPVYTSITVTPAPGSKTYNISIHTTSGTATLAASSNPAYILVEAI